MNLEESLNGNYLRLFGEVVTQDIYHLRDVADIVSENDPTFIHEKGHKKAFDFIPDVVIDLGANIGVFTRYAVSLWRDAYIIAVEPDQSNCNVFREHTHDERVLLIQKAIGHGDVYRCVDAANGAMECYFTQGAGYDQADLNKLTPLSVGSIMLTDLRQYIKPTDKVLLKLDIEGNETVMFSDPASMDMLKRVDYICMELHYYAADGDKLPEVKRITNEALASLSETHNTYLDNIYFYATKR